MSEFDILMVFMIVACAGFASWIVILSQKVKMLSYSLENVAAAHNALVTEVKQLERKLTNLGQ